MRRVTEDIRDMSRWKPCRVRPVSLQCTYRISGTNYYNTLGRSTSVANAKTPILLTDGAGVYWTCAVSDLVNNYCVDDGSPINEEVMARMKSGEFISVRQRISGNIWAFKVSVDDYRWDCPYGANASGVTHGDGDYLVCTGGDKPDLDTLKLVHNAEFKRFYMERSIVC